MRDEDAGEAESVVLVVCVMNEPADLRQKTIRIQNMDRVYDATARIGIILTPNSKTDFHPCH
jgi:hypothetical protein